MLSEKVRILDFDATVAGQQALVARYRPSVVDLRDLGPRVRLWSSPANACKVSAAFDPRLRNAVTFLGSGDFHHVSSLLIDQFDESITVIVIDHHPDWDILPPRLACGSWVTRVLRRPNVKKVVLLGIGSDDIAALAIQTGNLAALAHGRVEIYPCRRAPTVTLFRKVPRDNVSVRVRPGLCHDTIEWRQLQSMDLTQFISDLAGRLETKKVYVSVDKDCLRATCSLTNWEPGYLELPEVLLLLKLIREKMVIVGCDITGDYSPPVMDGKIKAFIASHDHPADFSARRQDFSDVQAVNEALNMRLLEALI